MGVAKHRAARRSRKQHQLGKGAVCVLCGEPHLELLIPVSDPSLIEIVLGVLELHHPRGRKHDSEFTIPLCPTCHRRVTLRQADSRVPLRFFANPLDRAVAIRRVRALFHRDEADAEEREAQNLEQLKMRLDAAYPDWREKTGGS